MLKDCVLMCLSTRIYVFMFVACLFFSIFSYAVATAANKKFYKLHELVLVE